MRRFSALLIGVGLLCGCVSMKPTAPKLEFGRQVAALKVTMRDVPNALRSHTPGKLYKVSVCLWNERQPTDEDDAEVRSREAQWIERNTGAQIAPGFVADILSSPQVILPPNEWRSMEVVQHAGSTVAEIKFRIDGALVSVGSHPGVTLKAHVEPLENGRVHVKGAMVLAKMSPSGTQYHAFPYDLNVQIDEPVIVYERGLR